MTPARDPKHTIFVSFLADFGPQDLEMAAACLGADSELLATIRDPFQSIFDDLGPDRLSET